PFSELFFPPRPRSSQRAVSRTKQGIVVTSGRHEAGARATASHTGALAGADDAGCRSSQEILDDLPLHVGQAEVPPAEAIRESRVLDAELVQDGRVPVVDRDRVTHHIVAEL